MEPKEKEDEIKLLIEGRHPELKLKFIKEDLPLSKVYEKNEQLIIEEDGKKYRWNGHKLVEIKE